MGKYLSGFKAYDVRGRVPDDLNEDLARKIGRAYADVMKPRAVAVGADMRLSSENIKAALTQGLLEKGVDVVDIGLGGTENIYFAAQHLESEGIDGGIMVTASHNPADYNGMKMVAKGSLPISGDSGLFDIEKVAASDESSASKALGKRSEVNLWNDYSKALLKYADLDSVKPLKVVVNPGNGCGGLAIDAIEKSLPFALEKVHYKPDGTFPHGVPNPLLEENRAPTKEAVIKSGADLGIAFDGDFDRCFFFDEKGNFVEGYYIVGLFAAEMLRQFPGKAVIHDPRLLYNTVEMVNEAGGRAVQSKAGHAFMKECMRKEDAVYGGEMSAHHYFKTFAFCDSGIIPFLLMANILSNKNVALSELMKERIARFPSSGEINRKLKDADAAIARVRDVYESDALERDTTDGFSYSYENWRFNLRKSNTEPLLRLNVESKGDEGLMREKTESLLALIDAE